MPELQVLLIVSHKLFDALTQRFLGSPNREIALQVKNRYVPVCSEIEVHNWKPDKCD